MLEDPEKIPELQSDEELDDSEIEKLEELRRNGVPEFRPKYDSDDEEEGDYYSLPPSRAGMMKDWSEWRTTINVMMSDVIAKRKDSGSDFETEREILTSPNSSKTPEFFSGPMSIHGQRVKDQYGCVAISEADDVKAKLEKKIMEGNFYLFGIPRISARRSSEGQLNIQCPSSNNSRRSSVDVAHIFVERKGRASGNSTASCDLINTEEMEDIEDRPFKGLAVARRNSLVASRRSSVASLARSSSNSSSTSLDSRHSRPRLYSMEKGSHVSNHPLCLSIDEDDESPLNPVSNVTVEKHDLKIHVTQLHEQNSKTTDSYPSGFGHCSRHHSLNNTTMSSNTFVSVQL